MARSPFNSYRPVFISYRRKTGRDIAGRLHDSLALRIGRGNVFRDNNDLIQGNKWQDQLETQLLRCECVLALIGSDWLDVDDQGKRRIDAEGDWVRKEIETALLHNVPVVPVLLDDVTCPAAEVLPKSIQTLPSRQAIRIRDERWNSDIDQVIALLKKRNAWTRVALPGFVAGFILFLGIKYGQVFPKHDYLALIFFIVCIGLAAWQAVLILKTQRALQ